MGSKLSKSGPYMEIWFPKNIQNGFKVTGGNHLQQLAHRKTGIGIVGHR